MSQFLVSATRVEFGNKVKKGVDVFGQIYKLKALMDDLAQFENHYGIQNILRCLL